MRLVRQAGVTSDGAFGGLWSGTWASCQGDVVGGSFEGSYAKRQNDSACILGSPLAAVCRLDCSRANVEARRPLGRPE
jgi:hypothetical protein